MKKVSIVVPVYNTERYLRRCLDSIRNQSYSEIQTIIVNDGSPDNAEESILQYIQEHSEIEIEYHKKENGGLSSARNYGLRYVKGEYIFFLDSDDYLPNDAIEQLVAGSENVDIVIGNFLFENGDSELKESDYPQLTDICVAQLNNQEYYELFYNSRYGISACNKLYSAIFLQKCGVQFQKNSEIYAEDLLFNLKLFSNNPKVKIAHVGTYVYCENSASITHTYKENLAVRFASLINDYYSYNPNDTRGVAYTTANAINTICAQEVAYKKCIEELVLFNSVLSEDIRSSFRKMNNVFEGVPLLRKIDYSISLKFNTRKPCIVAIYQALKRKIRGT